MGIPFSENELTVTGTQETFGNNPDILQFSYPVTEKEASRLYYDRKPVWTLIETEKMLFNPRIIPDNIARAFVADALPWDNKTQAGGPDMFGIPWVFEPEVGGSMEVQGSELFDDANDWRDHVVFPDIDSWDWEGCAKENEELLKTDKFVQMWIFTGWFERLISFMGFEDAAVALIDEDQQDAIAELLMALSDTYIDLIDHCHKYFHPDSIYIHDDWGSSQQPFFNFDVAAELIVPAMRKVTDHIHELGMAAELHSCGKCERQAKNFADAGWDSWRPQVMNDCAAVWAECGDRMAVGVPGVIPTGDSEEEQRAAARQWVETYCTTPGKLAWFPMQDSYLLTEPYREELYVASRKAYAAWPEA